MKNFVCAGIDPGGVTGIVIAKVIVESRAFMLHLVRKGSHSDPSVVLSSISQEKPVIVYLERRATNPSSEEGVKPYEVIRNGLEVEGFSFSKGVTDDPKKAILISPGIWKPFMQAYAPDITKWEVASQHEKDATLILAYGLVTNYPGRRVYYV